MARIRYRPGFERGTCYASDVFGGDKILMLDDMVSADGTSVAENLLLLPSLSDLLGLLHNQ